jgi:hypothetical protein
VALGGRHPGVEQRQLTFSTALVRESRLKLWKTNPMVRLRMAASSSFEWFDTTRPSSRYRPEVGRSRQPSRFMRVDLPEPEAPITAVNSPGSRASVTPARARSSTSPMR